MTYYETFYNLKLIILFKYTENKLHYLLLQKLKQIIRILSL
jgi:hypothetical protein